MNEFWTSAPNSEWGFVAITFAATYLGEIIALLNEELINAGKPTMGFINPLIYQNLDAFKDITLGSSTSTLLYQCRLIPSLTAIFVRSL